MLVRFRGARGRPLDSFNPFGRLVTMMREFEEWCTEAIHQNPFFEIQPTNGSPIIEFNYTYSTVYDTCGSLRKFHDMNVETTAKERRERFY